MRAITTAVAGATLAAAALLQPERAQAQQADAASALQTQASATVTVDAGPRELRLSAYDKVVCTIPAGPAGEQLAAALTGLRDDVYVAPERVARLCDGVISAGGPFSNGDVDVIAAQLRVVQVHKNGPATQRLQLLLSAAQAVVKAQEPRVTRDEQRKDDKTAEAELRDFERRLDSAYRMPAVEYRLNAALTPPAYRNVWQWLSLGSR